MILKKIYFLLLSAILAGVFGYFYNMNIKDNWHSRFNLKYNPTAIIYLKSLDENLTLLGSKSAAHQNLFEFVGQTIKNQEIYLNTTYRSLRPFQIVPNQMAFKSENLKKIDERVDIIIEDLNKIILSEVNTRVNTFMESAKVSLLVEREFKIQELKEAISYYKEKNLTPSSIPIKAIDTIDQYLISESKQEDNVLLEGLRNELKVYEKYSSFNKLEFLLEEKKRENLKNNLQLVKVDRLQTNLNKSDVLLLAGLKQRYNKRPGLNYSVISFSIIGLFIGAIILYLASNIKTLTRLVLKNLKTSQDQA